MPENSGTPVAWLSDLSRLVIGVRCVCSPDVAASRFVQRQRHAGHLDNESTFADVQADLEALTRLGPLALEPSIDVDTSHDVDTDSLVRQIEAVFARCRRV